MDNSNMNGMPNNVPTNGMPDNMLNNNVNNKKPKKKSYWRMAFGCIGMAFGISFLMGIIDFALTLSSNSGESSLSSSSIFARIKNLIPTAFALAGVVLMFVAIIVSLVNKIFKKQK